MVNPPVFLILTSQTFMANFIDSKRIHIEDLYRMKLFKKPRIITFSWSGMLIRPSEEVANQVVIEKIKDADVINIGYVITNDYSENQRYLYPVKLTRVPSNLGGFRYYFICPLTINGIPCRKRVSVLYRPDYETYFGCRHCHQIIYSTQMFNRKSSSYMEIKRQVIEKKIEELEDDLVRTTYKGKKTRKQQRLEKLYKEAENYPSSFYLNRR